MNGPAAGEAAGPIQNDSIYCKSARRQSHPAIPIDIWRGVVRKKISMDTCVHLAESGFALLAEELLRLRGDTDDR